MTKKRGIFAKKSVKVKIFKYLIKKLSKTLDKNKK
jgi:hypothetical protein